jgi:formate/nitrite transporter FocA (FNT family)
MADRYPKLTEHEIQEREEHTSPRAHVIHEAIREAGLEELRRSTAALLWSGVAAGLSMSFSLIAEGLLRSHLPDEPYRYLVSKLGYTVGFIVVIVGKQQLFTENTLTVVLPLMSRRDLATLLSMLRLWGLVLAANIVGAHAIAWVLTGTPLLAADVREAVLRIAEAAMEGDFGTILLRGIFAGWLIALVVWLRAAVESDGIGVIFLLTYLVGIGGFAHIIIGSIEGLCLVFTGAQPWLSFMGNYFAPALIGNIVGGVSLVAALNHAQVVAGEGN